MAAPGRTRRGGPWLFMAVAVLVVAGFGAWWTRADWWPGAPAAESPAPDPSESPAAVPPPEGLELPALSEAPPVLPAAEAAPLAPRRVARALAPALSDRDLGRHVSVLVAPLDAATPAFDNGGGVIVPASTMKLLTGAAALEALGPDRRFVTRVMRGPGRSLTLVGGGDPMLASTPAGAGQERQADLVTLAKRVAAALDESGARGPVRLRYDDSLFTGPELSPDWPAGYEADEVVAPITALMADGGRADNGWERVEDPSQVAADKFAAALQRQGIKVAGPVRPARVPAQAEELTSVSSPALSLIVEHLLEVSDNEITEVVAHQVGLEVADDGSFAGGADGVRRVLTDLGVPLQGADIRDGSGLSRANRLNPRTLAAVIRLSARSDRPELRAAVTGLPVAGFTGSLTYRYETGDAEGLGRVRAKTGTLSGVSVLAGIATGPDGTPMVFVMGADRIRTDRTEGARAALDEMSAALGACRCGLPSAG